MRPRADRPPHHSYRLGVWSGTGTGSRNWTYQCMPLQKGLFWECPHRHRA